MKKALTINEITEVLIIRKVFEKTILIIKNYSIQVTGKNQATHTYFTLPEDLCKKMAEVYDQGKQHSASSRFVYSCNGISMYKNTFQFGTAKAAVMNAISEHFGDGFQYLRIIKL